MLSKTRPTSLYLGMVGTNKYANFSGTLDHSGLVNYSPTTLLAKHFEYQGKANLTMKLNPVIGNEKIEWTNGRERFNACNHYRVRGVNVPHSYVRQTPRGGGTYQYFYRRGTSGSPVSLSGHVTSETRAASSRAWWTMQPRFEGQISMLNFLYELKDVKELAKQAYHILSKLKNFRRTFNHLKSTPKFDPTKSVAQIHLTTEFGIKPLLSDLSQIWKQLGDIVKQAQAEFAEDGDNAQTRHYAETLATSNTFSYSDWIGTGIKQSTFFKATLRYKYNYTLRDDFSAFTKYWGLDGSFEAFWEATPFSFLVDYFIKIGKAIHAMETDPNVVTIPIEYCESLTTLKTSGVHMTPNGSIKLGVIDGILTTSGLLSGYEAKLYTRRVVPPCKGLYIPLTAKPTDKQKLNIAAIVRSFF